MSRVNILPIIAEWLNQSKTSPDIDRNNPTPREELLAWLVRPTLNGNHGFYSYGE